jgi:hypothetical protein
LQHEIRVAAKRLLDHNSLNGSKQFNPFLLTSLVFSVIDDSINRPTSFPRSTVQKKIWNGHRLEICIWFQLLECFELFTRNCICFTIKITLNVTSFKLHITYICIIVCSTNGRTNCITRLDFEDFLFQIDTNALLSVWKTIHWFAR